MEVVTKKGIPTLAQEVALLRSAVIGFVGKDSEGKYRSAFVARTLSSLDKPVFDFSSKKDFLVRVRGCKTKQL